MDEIVSVIEILGNNLGPIGLAIVATVIAIGLAFKFSNIRHLELKSKLFSFSISKSEKKKKKADDDEE